MTTDTGLTNRLRQHSRRAGLAVGLTMAMTIAVCIGGFAVIYAQIQPFISDFVSLEAPVDDGVAVGLRGPTPGPTAEVAAAADDEDVDEADEDPPPDEEQDEEAPPPTEPPEPTPTPEGFVPDYQLQGAESVNLRGGPGTEFEVVIVLTPLQPLQYLGQDAPTDNPEDGARWMMFRTEDGLEGWVREIDVEPYDPNA